MAILMDKTIDAVADDPVGEPLLSPDARERVGRAGHNLWRVLDPSGQVLGHLQSRRHPLGTRFVARRYHAPTAGFRDLGEFWSADDAVACLRYSA